MRLGIYVDDVYRVAERHGGARLSVDRAFLLFACEVGSRFDRLVLFGRAVESPVSADYVLPDGVELAALPHYSSLHRLDEVTRGLAGTVRGMWRGLRRVDCVWIFGPHPLALLLTALAAARRKRIVLGVRMDSVRYYRARFPSGRWLPALIPIVTIDAAFRGLARFVPTTVVGSDLARRYGGNGRHVMTMIVSLVPAATVAARAPRRDWDGTIELLAVGRIDPEKNPRLIVEALRQLEDVDPGRFRLTWAGRGALEEEVRAMAAARGVERQLRLVGYVPFGPQLLDLYRNCHGLVHVSVTEGVPQVLIEALATGTPVIATDVGGVASLLEDGSAGRIVPPNDAAALVAAIRALVSDADTRDAMVARGLEVARALALEEQAGRVARFLASDGSGEAPSDPRRVSASD